MGEHICAVIDGGWIIEGMVVSRENDIIQMEDASVVRRWSNGRGIGGIADPEHKDEYTLDHIGDANVYAKRVIYEIPLGW